MRILAPVLLSAILVTGCSSFPEKMSERIDVPSGDIDPAGRWHRDKDGLITSGIAELVEEGRVTGPDVYDPLEDVPEFREIFAAADRLALKKCVDTYGPREKWSMGVGNVFYVEKKKILRERYRIDWGSPPELNPGTIYD